MKRLILARRLARFLPGGWITLMLLKPATRRIARAVRRRRAGRRLR